MATPTSISAARPTVRCPVGQNGVPVPCIALDFANGQEVAVGAASAASAVFDASNDRVVEMCADTDTWYTVGASPTASIGAGSQFLPAGTVRYVYVGAGNAIAVIQASAAGHCGMIPSLVAV